MTELVACLSTGKGSWAELYQLIKAAPWEKIILVTNDFGKEKFDRSAGNVEFVVISPEKPIAELTEDIRKEIASRIKGLEVALNVVSGSGKEHMALIAALIRLGVGFRLVAHTAEGLKEV